MFAIYKKEMRSYFINAIGYVYIAVFLAVSAFVCCLTTLHSQSYDVSTYFTLMLFALVVLIPLLTMKLFSEERKLRTEQLLLTAPVSITSMVCAKFFAALTLYAAALLLTTFNMVPLFLFADPELGIIVGNYVAIFLVGAAFIAIGTLISSLTENQLAAAIITMAVILALIGVGLFSSLISKEWIRVTLSWISVIGRFTNLSSGVFDLAYAVYTK